MRPSGRQSSDVRSAAIDTGRSSRAGVLSSEDPTERLGAAAAGIPGAGASGICRRRMQSSVAIMTASTPATHRSKRGCRTGRFMRWVPRLFRAGVCATDARSSIDVAVYRRRGSAISLGTHHRRRRDAERSAAGGPGHFAHSSRRTSGHRSAWPRPANACMVAWPPNRAASSRAPASGSASSSAPWPIATGQVIFAIAPSGE